MHEFACALVRPMHAFPRCSPHVMRVRGACCGVAEVLLLFLLMFVRSTTFVYIVTTDGK